MTFGLPLSLVQSITSVVFLPSLSIKEFKSSKMNGRESAIYLGGFVLLMGSDAFLQYTIRDRLGSGPVAECSLCPRVECRHGKPGTGVVSDCKICSGDDCRHLIYTNQTMALNRFVCYAFWPVLLIASPFLAAAGLTRSLFPPRRAAFSL